MKDDIKKPNLHIWRKFSEQFSLVRLKGKDPSEAEGKGWTDYCHKKRAFDEIPFQPGENAGIACGPASGIIVVDEDHVDKFREWLDDHGYFLPETRTHITGKGIHHLFQYPNDGKKYGCRSFKFKDDQGQEKTIFDIKGDGGQVVAPGSIHPDTGKLYSFGKDLPIAKAPKWVLDLALKEEKKPTARSQSVNDGDSFQWDGNIESLPIKPETKSMILQGVPKGQRSESQMVVLKALVWANLSDAEIFDVFQAYPIGEKWQGDWKGSQTSLQKEIDRARSQMEGQERAKKPTPKKQRDVSKAKSQVKSNGDRPSFELSDIGNGERFVFQHGENVRYCHPWASWFHWNGKFWEIDGAGVVKELAKRTARSIAADAQSTKDDETFKAVLKWAKRSTAQHSISAMLWMAESEKGIPIQPADLDQDHWLFNCANGTIDLKRGQLLPHTKSHLITKMSPITFDPDAKCPTWESFLDRIMGGNSDVISFLQRAIGYSLTGDDGEQCIFILYGTGANGKSTFLDTIKAMIGDYAKQAEFQTFLVKKSESVRNDIADLRGSRFVAAIEAEAGQRLAESVVKSMTGGDTLKARFLFKEYFEFSPTFKIFLASNHKPTIRGTDHAIWRRIRLIPFTVTIPECERDPRLKQKLLDEMPGILAWAVRGCLDWQRNGLGLPQEIIDATNEYREEMDALSGFVAECCIIDPNAKTKPSDLYSVYEQWCGGKGLSQKIFGQRIAEKGFEAVRDWKGRWWKGIGIIDSKHMDSEPCHMSDNDAFSDIVPSRENLFRNYKKNATSSDMRHGSRHGQEDPKRIKCVDCFYCQDRRCSHEKWSLAPRHGLLVLHDCKGFLGRGGVQ